MESQYSFNNDSVQSVVSARKRVWSSCTHRCHTYSSPKSYNLAEDEALRVVVRGTNFSMIRVCVTLPVIHKFSYLHDETEVTERIPADDSSLSIYFLQFSNHILATKWVAHLQSIHGKQVTTLISGGFQDYRKFALFSRHLSFPNPEYNEIICKYGQVPHKIRSLLLNKNTDKNIQHSLLSPLRECNGLIARYTCFFDENEQHHFDAIAAVVDLESALINIEREIDMHLGDDGKLTGALILWVPRNLMVSSQVIVERNTVYNSVNSSGVW